MAYTDVAKHFLYPSIFRKMEEIGKRIIKGKLRIVTPVHIGGAQEKHLQKGLDYITKGSTIYFLDEKKLITAINDVGQYSNALANGKLDQLIVDRKIDLNTISKKITSVTGEVGTDIKINIKNALNGKPIIPGSSLKGALRSVFVNKLGGAKQIDNFGKKQTIEPFGKIQEDINRFLIVSDIECNSSSFINTKTYNIFNKNGFNGGWKHELKFNTTDKFSDKGFTFVHEVINIDYIGEFFITINIKALENAIQEQKKIFDPKKNILKTNKNIEDIYFSTSEELFKIIQNYTKMYIAKEIKFYEKYKGEFYDDIVTEYKHLLELNEKSPLIRLGLGSGFHAMTGDPYQSHEIDSIDKRGKFQNKDSAKSRKLAISKFGDKYKFYPMGFVQLMTDEHYEQHFKAEFEAKKEALIKSEIKQKQIDEADREALEAVKIKAANDAIIQAEQEELARIEALKPKTVEISMLKKAKWVDGIVVGQDGKRLLFKPFISGFENTVQWVTYSSGMPNDTIIQIMCSSPNGKILQFSGSPKIKA